MSHNPNHFKENVSPRSQAQPGWGSWSDWKQLCKLKLVVMSVFTAGIGYGMSPGEHLWSVWGMVLLGVFLLGCGASILNNVFEIETDRLMERTADRPLPAGRVSPLLAERVGYGLFFLSLFMMGFLVHPVTGGLTYLAFVSYVYIYTPLKSSSSLCTLTGAFPGALPVLIGWSAGDAGLSLGGWILFAILFLWQLPHFMAIAWLCKEQYQAAGLQMATVIDPSGTIAGLQALVYALVLIPVSLAPSLVGMTGTLYFVVALGLGCYYLWGGWKLWSGRTMVDARRLLKISVVYLPVLYLFLLTT